MRQRQRLTKEQQRFVDEMSVEIINSISEVGSAQVATELRWRLRRKMEDYGNLDAENILKDWEFDGAEKQAKRILKRDKSHVKLTTGNVVVVPTRLGVRAVDSAGVRQTWFQQPLWWEMPWARFAEMVAVLESQRARLSTEITAFSQVYKYRALYPDSKTPLEACERAGVDPQRIGFENERAA